MDQQEVKSFQEHNTLFGSELDIETTLRITFLHNIYCNI